MYPPSPVWSFHDDPFSPPENGDRTSVVHTFSRLPPSPPRLRPPFFHEGSHIRNAVPFFLGRDTFFPHADVKPFFLHPTHSCGGTEPGSSPCCGSIGCKGDFVAFVFLLSPFSLFGDEPSFFFFFHAMDARSILPSFPCNAAIACVPFVSAALFAVQVGWWRLW